MTAPAEVRILRNSARCLLCQEEVESTHRHDMRWCSCGAVAVDGGHAYLRRVWDGSRSPDGMSVPYEDTSTTEEVP